jgi:hypothetical protein
MGDPHSCFVRQIQVKLNSSWAEILFGIYPLPFLSTKPLVKAMVINGSDSLLPLSHMRYLSMFGCIYGVTTGGGWIMVAT